MEYRRYGKFRFFDYTSTWLVIVFLCGLIVVGFLTETQFYLMIWPILLLVIMVWSIYKPNNERFSISGGTIIIMRGRKKDKIDIPSEPTLIVSYADICPPLAKRMSYGNQTYMLKGRYAISILQKIPLEIAIVRLHENYTRKYTNSTVEACFDEHLYVYSFVGNQEIVDKLIANNKCQIIIPESLLSQLPINLNQINAHIDAGY